MAGDGKKCKTNPTPIKTHCHSSAMTKHGQQDSSTGDTRGQQSSGPTANQHAHMPTTHKTHRLQCDAQAHTPTNGIPRCQPPAIMDETARRNGQSTGRHAIEPHTPPMATPHQFPGKIGGSQLTHVSKRQGWTGSPEQYPPVYGNTSWIKRQHRSSSRGNRASMRRRQRHLA